MRFAHVILAALFSLMLLGMLDAQDILADQDNQSTCIYFFYGAGCPHCARVEPFIEQVAEKYNLTIHSYEIYGNMSNRRLLTQYFSIYNVSVDNQGIPAVFVADKYYIGDEPIIQNLENEIKALQQCDANVTNPTGLVGLFSTFYPSEVSLWAVTAAGLADSVNPCTIGVLLILLTLLAVSGDKREALKSGLAYILAVYITYTLLGLGILIMIQSTGISSWIYNLVGVIAIIIGVLGVRDYLLSKKANSGPGYSVPQMFRPFMRDVMARITNPIGAFIAGIFITLFELPCTGQVYGVVLGMLAEKSTQAAAIPVLLYYNILYVLPMILVLAFVSYGLTTIEKTKEWKDRNMKKLTLAAGILMILIGIYVLLTNPMNPILKW